ncbi:MAG: nuclear transport factor 2 family protein [Pseudomonadota bacterium]
MATTQDILDVLKAAYQLWDDSKGHDPSGFIDLMADDFTLKSIMGVPLASSTQMRSGPAEADAYFEQLIQSWEMIHYTVERFVSDDMGNIVMLGSFEWKYRETGKSVSGPKMDHWIFNLDGKATSLFEMFDTAALMLATGEAKLP